MSKLCERPGCSEPGAVAYGMVPEDLLFWIAPLVDAPQRDPALLCKRHADAMVVPRGWTLDDRREAQPRLFKPRSERVAPSPASRSRRRHPEVVGEQLQIDGTGEIARPAIESEPTSEHVADTAETAMGTDDGAAPGTGDDMVELPWTPDFDDSDDLGGLLEVSSPLLARAFRGTDRRRA